MEVVLNAFDFCHGLQSLAGLWSYIDPGTGSLLFQVVAATLISAGLFIAGVRDRIVWLVTSSWRSKSQPTTDASENLVRDDHTLDHQAVPPSTASPQDRAPRKAA